MTSSLQPTPQEGYQQLAACTGGFNLLQTQYDEKAVISRSLSTTCGPCGQSAPVFFPINVAVTTPLLPIFPRTTTTCLYKPKQHSCYLPRAGQRFYLPRGQRFYAETMSPHKLVTTNICFSVSTWPSLLPLVPCPTCLYSSDIFVQRFYVS